MDAPIELPTLPLPRAWQDDPELRDYHRLITRYLEQLYQEAFWTMTTSADDITTSSTFNHPVNLETVIMTNTTAKTVTLHDGAAFNEPRNGDTVRVQRHGTGAVTVDGGAYNIDGAGTVAIAAQYDHHVFMFSDDAGEWIEL